MDLRQLRCVVAVAEELHFGRAARRLHMSQAPLSAQIQRTERELGHQLFERTTRSVSLTPVGAELYRRAVVVLRQLDEMVSDLDLVAAGRAGRLRIGFVSSASYSVLPEAVRRMRQAAPDLELDLVPLTTPAQADRLLEDELDVGVVRGDVGWLGLPTELVFAEPLVAILPAQHPLAGLLEISPLQLSEESMVFFASADMPGFVAEIRRVFDGITFPRVRHRVVHQETALGFVAAGEGFTVLPASVSHFEPAAVRVVPIAGAHHTAMHVAFPPRGPSPAARLMADALQDAIEASVRATHRLIEPTVASRDRRRRSTSRDPH